MTTPVKTIEDGFGLTILSTFLTFICKDQFCSHAFLMCDETVLNVMRQAVGVTPTTWKFVSLSLESSVGFLVNIFILFFPPPVFPNVSFFCLTSQQSFFQWFSRHWLYLSKHLYPINLYN